MLLDLWTALRSPRHIIHRPLKGPANPTSASATVSTHHVDERRSKIRRNRRHTKGSQMGQPRQCRAARHSWCPFTAGNSAAVIQQVLERVPRKSPYSEFFGRQLHKCIAAQTSRESRTRQRLCQTTVSRIANALSTMRRVLRSLKGVAGPIVSPTMAARRRSTRAIRRPRRSP